MKYSSSPALAEWLIYFSDGFMCNSMREHSLAYTDTKRTSRCQLGDDHDASTSNVTRVTMHVTPFFLAASDKRPNLLFSSSTLLLLTSKLSPTDPFLP